MLLSPWPNRTPVFSDKTSSTWTPQWSQFWSALVNAVNASLLSVQQGDGSPEGVVTAKQGTMFLRSDGGTNTTLYVKTSGGVTTPTSTGWTAK